MYYMPCAKVTGSLLVNSKRGVLDQWPKGYGCPAIIFNNSNYCLLWRGVAHVALLSALCCYCHRLLLPLSRLHLPRSATNKLLSTDASHKQPAGLSQPHIRIAIPMHPNQNRRRHCPVWAILGRLCMQHSSTCAWSLPDI